LQHVDFICSQDFQDALEAYGHLEAACRKGKGPDSKLTDVPDPTIGPGVTEFRCTVLDADIDINADKSIRRADLQEILANDDQDRVWFKRAPGAIRSMNCSRKFNAVEGTPRAKPARHWFEPRQRQLQRWPWTSTAYVEIFS
jgi:hypothetical protein